jgi:thiol:disulfide interchange protein
MLERRYSILAAAMSLLLCLVVGGSAADAKRINADEPRAVASIAAAPLTWHNDLSKSLATASSKNKLVLIDFYTDWCGWCKKLDRDTYTDASVITYLNDDFVCVKLDAEDGGQGEAAAKKYQVRAFPAILVLEPSGKLVGAMYGYKNAQDFPAAVKELTGR